MRGRRPSKQGGKRASARLSPRASDALEFLIKELNSNQSDVIEEAILRFERRARKRKVRGEIA